MNGRVIADRYELGAILGQGGMGQVWTGYDRRLARRVAVKLLHPSKFVSDTEADELRQRFARECRVTAQVRHPGLVTVHDAGRDADELYLVMEYVEGADLADHLAENDPYPLPWAVAVAAQLSTVLAAVHAVPIVHRDLKPRNAIVRPDGTVVVLDMGVAFVMDSDTTGLTRTGSPLGSPAYMAPEQAMGGTVDTRTDLYALGVVLHELVGGRAPFTGTTALGVMHRHLYEPPVPLRQIRPEVPATLEALVLRLLAKEPRHRPADAQEVFGELVGLLADLNPAAPAGGPMHPTRPFLHPQAPWPSRRPTPSPAAPGRPAEPPRIQAPTTRRIPEALDEARRLLDQGRIAQAADVLGNVLPAAVHEHGPHSPIVHMLRKQFAVTLTEDGQYARARSEWSRLADERAAVAGPSDREALAYRYEAAQCLERLGAAGSAHTETRPVRR